MVIISSDKQVAHLIEIAKSEALRVGADPAEIYVQRYLAALALGSLKLTSSGFKYSRLPLSEDKPKAGTTPVIPPTTAL